MSDRRKCPACGAKIVNEPERHLTRDDLLRVLHATPRRQVYLSVNGNWCVSQGGGRAFSEDVHALAKQGLIQPVYSNTGEAFHVGPTLDVDRTLEARKVHGNRAPNFYL